LQPLKTFTLTLALILLSAASAHAQLTGVQVFGAHYSGVIPSNNDFDPVYGLVPPGSLNLSGPTVTIGAGTEFVSQGAYFRSEIDFGNDTLTLRMLALHGFSDQTNTGGWDFSLPGLPAFTGLSLISSSFNSLTTWQLSGETLEFRYGNESFADASIKVATFAIQSNVAAAVPEPSTYGMLGATVLGVFAYRRRQQQNALRSA
jgi:hypothetical protein